MGNQNFHTLTCYRICVFFSVSSVVICMLRSISVVKCNMTWASISSSSCPSFLLMVSLFQHWRKHLVLASSFIIYSTLIFVLMRISFGWLSGVGPSSVSPGLLQSNTATHSHRVRAVLNHQTHEFWVLSFNTAVRKLNCRTQAILNCRTQEFWVLSSEFRQVKRTFRSPAMGKMIWWDNSQLFHLFNEL